MSSPISLHRDGDVAVIISDNQPVNALSHAVRAGLDAALAEAEADPAIRAVVIRCAGRTFFAGADITEFDKPMKSPGLRDVIARMDAFPKPIVAAIHGTALGGGFELALGCHYRLALAGTQFGLPEVKLGILPGAGGTQRLPRLIGARLAMEIMTSGDFIPAERALKGGVIDQIVPDLEASAIAFARDVAGIRPLPTVSSREDKLAEGRADPTIFSSFAASIAKKTRGFPAPGKIIEATRLAHELPFAEGLEREMALFIELMHGIESRAQRYFFFAEREAAKIPDVPSSTPVLPIKRAVVIGAGTMGGGIAMNYANAGIPVTIIETGAEALERGLKVIRGNYEATARRGGLSPAEAEARFARISGSLDLADAATADIVTEAVFEEMGIKKELFGKLDKICRPDAILATNTSTLDVDQIASATSRPDRVIGMHYFSPANVMKLLELVRGKETSKEVIATAMALARKLKKVPALVGVCYGFVGNRMLHRRSTEVEGLLLAGASPSQMDRVIFDFGFPMGPCAMGDLAGLDVSYRIRKGRGERSALFDRIVEAGRLGQKTGKGIYSYNPGDRTPIEDPAVEAMIIEAAAEEGITRRPLSDGEIMARLTYPMINEAARILEEGIALRPSDIDVIWVYGYGWPVYTGGPIFWADQVGTRKIRDALAAMHAAGGDASLKPAALLNELADADRGFLDWGRGR